MTNEIETVMHTFLSNLSTTVDITPLGQTIRDGWECDEWRVVLSRAGKNEAYRTSYFTGLGHRKADRTGRKVAAPPEIAGIMSSLLADAEAGGMSFRDWCDGLGYEFDSRKALATYDACVAIDTAMRRLFTSAELTEMRAIVTDY